MAQPLVSVVVPVYNGSYFLESCVTQIRDYFAGQGIAHEIIIAEDGSTDGSKALCRELKRRFPEIELRMESDRLGRGESLRRAILASHGDVVLYTDVDMAADIGHMADLVRQVHDGSDIVSGSRYLPGSHAERMLTRLVASRVYNRLVRLMLHSQLTDHQCGLKAFKREAILELLPEVKAAHWFWDTEILIRAQVDGMRVREVPVQWSESEADKSTVRLMHDSRRFLSEIIRLKSDLEAE